MINLFSLCEDLKKSDSKFKISSNKIISDIYNFLNSSSKKTESLLEGWRDDFKYIYGDVTTNLSSNSKLNVRDLFCQYNINIQNYNVSNLQILFFAIQTYFNLLIKIVMNDTLQSIREEEKITKSEIILGTFAKKYGIKNYCFEDWYCWPIFELDNGFEEIFDELKKHLDVYSYSVSINEFQSLNNYDFVKQIYEAIIPRELRHALGEYYTPDWLAEYTIKNAFESYDEKGVKEVSIIDPTCGSGTFLFKTINEKRKAGCSLFEILNTVHGIDINPLAVLTAKTNYVLSVLDFIDTYSEIEIPIYCADIIKISENDNRITNDNCVFFDDPVMVVRNNYNIEYNNAKKISKQDIVIGNPPWVNWEYMPELYRKNSQDLWVEYELFSAKGRNLSFSKEDISVLITYIVMDKLLKDNGVLAFVIRQGVFKSAQNGVGFRRFKIKNEKNIKVLKVEDLSNIKAFDNAVNNTALFFAIKNQKTVYPVQYLVWEKDDNIKRLSFNAYSNANDVLQQMKIIQQKAMPVAADDETSMWLTTDVESLSKMKLVLGKNNYRARTGVFTGGANAVYWLDIKSSDDENVSVSNIVERAKRKSEKISANIEKTHVYPMLKGSNVRKWNVTYDTYLLCPHTEKTKMWPVSQTLMKQDTPNTFSYLYYFKEDLDGRNGFAGWEKDIQNQEFHAILRVGDYTFSKYKVIWRYIASEFVCAVIGTVNDNFLGEKLLIPNEKIMYVSLDNEVEAYYLCGVLSSTLIANCVKSYMNPTSISAHVLNKLNIPQYNPTNSIHQEIASICKDGHGKDDISTYVKRIDELVMSLYEEE